MPTNDASGAYLVAAANAPTIPYMLGVELADYIKKNAPLDFAMALGVLRVEFVPFSPLPNPRDYTPLSVNCNISHTSLADAARILGPAFVYDLYVNPYIMIDTRSTLRRMQPTEYSDNPLIPHINLHPDDSLDRYEWYLSANGKGCGSKGV